jgi:quinol monooxygenase YgiN
MTFANVGTLGTQPGQLDAVVDILTRPNPALAKGGCLLYEVGTSEDLPDTVFVAELWISEAAHQQSLQLPSVRETIAEAMPLLTGEMSGFKYDVAGSPLRE